MRTIREGMLYQLTFMPRLFPVNCYLVEEEDSLTLIDAALPYSSKGILRAIQAIGKPLTRIVLTHAHDDHIGALDQLRIELPDVSVYISHRDARLLQGDRSLEPNEPTTPIRGGVPSKIKTKPDVFVADQDRIGSLLALAAPGHTPGSMAFLDTRTHALIAGDAFSSRGGLAVAGQLVPWFPFPALATWNPEVALISAQKLQEYQPSILAVGHGEFIHQPAGALQRAIDHAIRKLDQTKQNGA